MCTNLKSRGIKIAILYTEYLQLINLGPSQNITDSWYMSWVNQYDNPHVRNRHGSHKICKRAPRRASFPTFRTGGDISTALTNLFIKVASSTASLTQ